MRQYHAVVRNPATVPGDFQAALRAGQKFRLITKKASGTTSPAIVMFSEELEDQTREPLVWLKMPGVVYTATAGSRLYNLQTSLRALGTILTNCIVTYTRQQAFRLFDRSGAYYESANLDAQGPVLADTGLMHDYGSPKATVLSEMKKNKDKLEGILGHRVKVLAWPYHYHDVEAMRQASLLGFLGARDGTGGYLPASSGFSRHDNEDITKSWEKYPSFEIPAQAYFDVSNVSGKNQAQMIAMLYATAANQTTPTSPLHGKASLMELWKANNTLVTFLDHGTLTADEMQWLLEIFLADADTLVDTLGRLTEYARLFHSGLDGVMPPTITSTTPWKGKKMAFSMCWDDPHANFMSTYHPRLVTMGVKRVGTVFIASANIGSTISEAQLRTVDTSEHVEIGAHTETHTTGTYIFDEVGVRIQAPDLAAGERLGIQVTKAVNDRVLQFYVGMNDEYPTKLGSNLAFWLSGNDLAGVLATGATITSWRDRVQGLVLQQHAALARPVFELATLSSNHNGVDGAGDVLSCYPGDTLFSNTNGMMVFFTGSWTTSQNRKFISQYQTISPHRLWDIGPNLFRVHEVANADTATGADPYTPGYFPSTTRANVALYWKPGEGPKAYINGVLRATGATTVTSLDTGLNVPLMIGGFRAANLPLIGKMTNVLIVPKADLGILQRMFGYLSRETGIALA